MEILAFFTTITIVSAVVIALFCFIAFVIDFNENLFSRSYWYYFLGVKYFKTGNHKKSYDLFTQAVALQNAKAMVFLGYMTYNGLGTPRNANKAAQLYHKAITLANIPQAYNLLGILYARGHGVPQNPALAVYNWKLALSLGDEIARYNIAQSLFIGFGVKRDLTESERQCKLLLSQCNYERAWHLLNRIHSDKPPPDEATIFPADEATICPALNGRP